MNRLKTLLITALAFSGLNAVAQTDKATTAKIVEAKTYTFVARSVTPLNTQDISNVMSKMPGAMQGGVINLTETYYEVKVTPDSVVAFLPYYGRSFSAPINQNDGGVKFTSKKFEYKSTKGKKHGWDTLIETKDARESYRLAFNISDNGYVTLSLNSNNKQSVTYQGYLKENGDK
ncbi:DUF4251 domain-containing protein [Pedobacter chitinilyticus]|uniref:DUF4251 domain-containing protein n=1 Tax=Pedobacter chitinilyticus TaxID=2233776 RepID=A0A443YRG9_9SPHI|nr:DUF4251 domain-containing protein [Pedobacter chitinilyticus]RWU06397.1 DUF4251 domain-containing protein [Pedobacter chitinilyticus]